MKIFVANFLLLFLVIKAGYDYYSGIKKIIPGGKETFLTERTGAITTAWFLQKELLRYTPFPLGIRANSSLPSIIFRHLWTETVVTKQRFDYLLLPRICALAEAAWTQSGNKDFKNFSLRIEDDYALFRKMRVNYFVPGSGNINEPAR